MIRKGFRHGRHRTVYNMQPSNGDFETGWLPILAVHAVSADAGEDSIVELSVQTGPLPLLADWIRRSNTCYSQLSLCP